MERLDRFGVNERVTALTLPLGYSFNLDGSMVYQAFAVLFIAQAYGIDMSIGHSDHAAARDDAVVEGDRRRAARLARRRRRGAADVRAAGGRAPAPSWASTSSSTWDAPRPT